MVEMKASGNVQNIPKKWYGTWPSNCQRCGDDLSKTEYFCDARSITGQWLLCCPQCHQDICLGRLGTGKGQKYDSKTLEKIEG